MWVWSYYLYLGQLYAVQQGIQLGKGDEGAKAALLTIMDDLQSVCYVVMMSW